MRTFKELLPRTLLPRVPLGSAGGLPPLASPDYLPAEEYSRPLTTTFLSLGVVLCTVLFLALIICCAARLAGRIHEHRRVRMRDRQGLTSGRMMMMRRLEVLRKGEVLGQETVIKIGTVVVATEEKGKGGKKDNIDENDGCNDEKKLREDLEKGGGGGGGGGRGGEEEGRGGGGWSEWDVGGYGEPPKYDAVGFNEKGEMIDAPCPLYPPGVKSMANGLAMGMGVLVCW